MATEKRSVKYKDDIDTVALYVNDKISLPTKQVTTLGESFDQILNFLNRAVDEIKNFDISSIRAYLGSANKKEKDRRIDETIELFLKHIDKNNQAFNAQAAFNDLHQLYAAYNKTDKAYTDAGLRVGKEEDYIAQLKKGKIIPENYWLCDTDINDVFKQVLNPDKDTKQISIQGQKQNIYVLSPLPLELDQSNVNIQLLQDAVKNVRESRKKSNQAGPYNIYLPVNRGQNHWAFMKFEVLNEDKTTITYTDSLGADESVKQNIKMLLNTFPNVKPDNIHINFSEQQRDDWTCGYRTIHSILNDIGVRHPIVDSVMSAEKIIPEKLRDNVLKVLRDSAGVANTTSKRSFKDLREILAAAFKTKSETVEIHSDQNKAVIDKHINVSQDSNSYIFSATNPDDKLLEKLVEGTVSFLQKMNLPANTPIEMKAPAGKEQLFLKLAEEKGLVIQNKNELLNPKSDNANEQHAPRPGSSMH